MIAGIQHVFQNHLVRHEMEDATVGHAGIAVGVLQSRGDRVSPLQRLSAREGIQVVPRIFFALSFIASGRFLFPS